MTGLTHKKIMSCSSILCVTDSEYPRGTGGSVYDGRQQVLYWADVMSEVAFVVPSIDSYNRYLADPQGGKCLNFHNSILPNSMSSLV
jgi:hypothetical protein